MLIGQDELKFIAGSEDCYKLTITDGSCATHDITELNVNRGPTYSKFEVTQEATDNLPTKYTYTSPIYFNGQAASGTKQGNINNGVFGIIF